MACGYCPDCRGGHDNLCRNWQGYGVTLPGGFADYVRIRAVDAEPVPPSVPHHWATLAEPLSCVLHAMDRMGPVRPGDSALVIGAGPTGLMISQLLTAAGASVDVVERVGFCRDRCGRGGDGTQAAAVELHRVFADLQNDRPAGLFCAGDDGLGVLKGDDVECRQSFARAVRGGDEVGGSGERHRDVLPGGR